MKKEGKKLKIQESGVEIIILILSISIIKNIL